MKGIEVLLELKDKFSKGINSSVKTANKGLGKLREQSRKTKLSFSNAFGQMKSELPLLGRGIELLTNKWVLMGAGIVGIGFLLKNATKSAGDFNAEFLHIKNLNLDKSERELKKYKDNIKDTAFNVGLDLKETTKAFYDVQSATGFFGKEAEKVVEQVGKFSIATGADLNDSINATTKTLKAFGLGAKDTKMILESNAKTVQVGITTFEELARVQTEYAGAASGMGQSVNTANKIFAAFTSIAKDSNTAATMTKTAFQGLSQKNTIEGLKNIGVNIYDTNGNMRDLAKVLQEVSGKFKTMNSKEIDTLINKIGGPEGLRNLFTKLKTGADDFFGTLEAFDSSKFNMDKALKNAQGDFNKLSKIVKNRWGVVMTNLGEKILPLVAKGLNAINSTLMFFGNLSNTTKNILSGVGIVLSTLIGTTFLWNKILLISAVTGGTFTGILGGMKIALIAIKTAIFNIPIVGWILAGVSALIIMYQKWDKFRYIVDGVWESIKGFFTNLKDNIKRLGQIWWTYAKIVGNALTLDFSGVKENFKELKKLALEQGKEVCK